MINASHEIRIAALDSAVRFFEGAAPSSDAVLMVADKFEEFILFGGARG